MFYLYFKFKIYLFILILVLQFCKSYKVYQVVCLSIFKKDYKISL